MITGYIILGVAILILLNGLFIVKQQSAAIIERFGKFVKISNPGINFKIPVIDKIAGRVNLKVQQLDVLVETKTKDDVFVRLKISVQFRVGREKIYDAFYQLEDPHGQIDRKSTRLNPVTWPSRMPSSA